MQEVMIKIKPVTMLITMVADWINKQQQEAISTSERKTSFFGKSPVKNVFL